MSVFVEEKEKEKEKELINKMRERQN